MQKSTVQLGQYEAAYIEYGVQDNPVLLFLHGFLGESSLWRLLMERLADRYRCIALDLLGFGRSSKPKLKYTIWHQTAFVSEFIAALKLTNVTLIGHSYGGWASSALAIEQADTNAFLLEYLILIAPAGIRDDSFVGRYNYMRPILWETPVVDWVLTGLKPLAKVLGQQKTYDQVAMARREFGKQPVAKSFIVDRLRPEDAIDTVEKGIHKIAVPTLVIAGAQDTTIPLWHCETYGHGVPGAKFEVLPEADHDLIRTDCDQISNLIALFLTPSL
ncbi:alpha/beta hydrolase [Leptolyngbyaceae cyanobacterium CCMR0082]|uniref:Alpha/beta hydrolase n=1 Tax=Adonisia turfae CCMR0082 TaxID=2304604 RepID=A0A6M0S178_9CYAN|nr:alpha/beta hydrolase [Leptothoe sp. LEGE 181152]NEZ62225.1 alpha/beta hydrolase [Adonisia turfae CCMR0082]